MYALHEDRAEDDTDPRLIAFMKSYDALIKTAKEAVPPDPIDTIDLSARQAFATGALLLKHYYKTIVSDTPLVDTCGSQTLSEFVLDYHADDDLASAFEAVTISAMGLSDNDNAQIHSRIQPEINALTTRHKIIAAIDSYNPLTPDTPDLNQRVFELFGACFPGHPLRVGEIFLIRTGTVIYFCLPIKDGKLQSPTGPTRTSAEQHAVNSFIETAMNSTQQSMSQFPAFGGFQPTAMDPGLKEHLLAVIDEDPDQIMTSLGSSVSLLSSLDIDKYIVHDAWGHQWQAHLMAFEDDYSNIANFTDPPQLSQAFPTQSGSFITMTEAITSALEKVSQGQEIAESHWDEYLHAALVSRIFQSMAPLYAELLADLVEYKFIATAKEHAHWMESSSYFRSHPTKLDLTLLDFLTYFRMGRRGFRELTKNDDVVGRLHTDWMKHHPHTDPDAIKNVLTSFRTRTEALLLGRYKARFVFSEEGDRLQVNLFTRMALALLGTHVTFNDVYHHLEQSQTEYVDPITDFRDLLALTSGSFYQMNPEHHFWHMDEYISLFPQLLNRTLHALASESKSNGT